MGWMATLWLAGGLGLPANDIVSLVPIEGYFKSHGITASPRTMFELAAKEPADPRTQVRQLLAIRWLGENAAQTMKTEGAHALLEQIAAGKKAQDAHGFARGHAAQALARIAGKPVPALALATDKSLRADALAWFSPSMPIFSAYELRPSRKTSGAVLQTLRKQILDAMDEAMTDQLYSAIDIGGNFRIDRISSGMRLALKPGQPTQFCARLSGKGDPRALGEMLAYLFKGATLEKKKGPSGEPVQVIATLHLAVAIVGDSDALLAQDSAGFAAGFIKEMLDVKARKLKSAREGPLGALLRGVSDEACHLNAMETSKELWEGISGGPIGCPVLPSQLLFTAVARDKFELETWLSLKDRDEAKTFAEFLAKRKDAWLKLLEAPPRLPPETAKQWRQLLQATKIEAAGSRVRATLAVENVEALLGVLKLMRFGE